MVVTGATPQTVAGTMMGPTDMDAPRSHCLYDIITSRRLVTVRSGKQG